VTENQDNLPQVPLGWVWIQIDEIGENEKYAIVDGPFGSHLKISDYVDDGEYPVISITNIDKGFQLKNLRYINQAKFETIKRSAVKPGDIIMAKIGATYGKCGYYPDWMPVGIISANLLKITASNLLAKRFVYYYFKTKFFKEKLDSIVKSTAQPAFNVTAFKSLSFPLAPLNEQRRIVAKIEALKARSQRVKEELEAARTLEDTLVAYYTTRWHEEELGKHIEERKELAGEYWYKYPVVGLSNEGKITERREPIGQKTAHKCKVIRQGDIVFNPIRFSIGSIARYRGTEPAIVSSEYQVFRTKSTMSAELLCRYLRTKQGQSRLEIETQGSVRYRVYFHNLQRLVMPIASPEQQAEAEQFFVCLNKTFEVVEQAMSKIPQLEQSILAKAFRGELVPQDPNDEPASVLLERICAEREKLDTNKKAKGKTEKKSRKAKPEAAEPEQLSLPGFE
jgi:type I restriction enzyme S subunit